MIVTAFVPCIRSLLEFCRRQVELKEQVGYENHQICKTQRTNFVAVPECCWCSPLRCSTYTCVIQFRGTPAIMACHHESAIVLHTVVSAYTRPAPQTINLRNSSKFLFYNVFLLECLRWQVAQQGRQMFWGCISPLAALDQTPLRVTPNTKKREMTRSCLLMFIRTVCRVMVKVAF